MKFLEFKFNNSHYALNIENVIEILKYQPINSIIGSDKDKIGMVQIRDKVYSVVDLKHLICEESSNDNGYFIIVKEDDKQLALLVEEVCDIVEAEETDLQEPNDSLKNTKYNMLSKFIVKADSLISLLSMKNIVNQLYTLG